jgi:hypothetical protein
MKIDRLETHDRYQYFLNDQSKNIWIGAEECLKNNPLSLALQENSPYIYIFAHARTCEDGTTKKMFWSPRLSKPEAQSNSYLFRATSKTDLIEICWIIPSEEMWNQYKKGNVTESSIVTWSIDQFRYNKKWLERPHSDDISEERGKQILLKVLKEHEENLKNSKLHSLEVSQSS